MIEQMMKSLVLIYSLSGLFCFMSSASLFKAIQKYRKLSRLQKKKFFKKFELKMIYRTTKTENPKTTLGLVKRTLAHLKR